MAVGGAGDKAEAERLDAELMHTVAAWERVHLPGEVALLNIMRSSCSKEEFNSRQGRGLAHTSTHIGTPEKKRGPLSSVNEQNLSRFVRAAANQTLAATKRWRHRLAMCELVGETGSVACAASTLRNLTAAPTARPSVIALRNFVQCDMTLFRAAAAAAQTQMGWPHAKGICRAPRAEREGR